MRVQGSEASRTGLDSFGHLGVDLVAKQEREETTDRNVPLPVRKLLAFVYHCFDRIVIQGYLPLLSREAHVVYFFRDVRGEYPITEKVLQRRTNAYRAWVDSYARNHRIPMEKAKKNVSKEDHVRPYLRRMVAALPASQKAFLLLGVDHSLSATEHPGVQTD